MKTCRGHAAAQLNAAASTYTISQQLAFSRRVPLLACPAVFWPVARFALADKPPVAPFFMRLLRFFAVPRSHAAARQTPPSQQDATNWHRALADAVRDPDELVDLLGLAEDCREPARRAARLFPLLVPRNYLSRIEPGNPRDPLLLQVLPLADEETVVDGFSADAVGDAQAHRSPGLLQKYAGRALLITTGACAVHCRYCFRREFPYGEEPRTMEDWEPAFAEIAADSSLHEIILSGGDPLMLTDARLAMFVERLDHIGHVRRLRIHTRLPIVLPQRITDALLEMLATTRLTPIVVVHANHAHELQGDCAAALRTLVRGGINGPESSRAAEERQRHDRGPSRVVRTFGRFGSDPLLPAPTRPRQRRCPL